MHQCHVEGHRSCATPGDAAKAGPEPKIAAVERREASVPRRADGVSYLRGDARAYVTGPL
jgi:hypothetical protein